jgi:hypothetical protein
MIIDSSSEAINSVELREDQILTYLSQEGLIGDYRTHSAKEQQGLE